MQEHRIEHRTESGSCSWLTATHSLANTIFLAILQRHADIGSKVLGATISVTTTVIATARTIIVKPLSTKEDKNITVFELTHMTLGLAKADAPDHSAARHILINQNSQPY